MKTKINSKNNRLNDHDKKILKKYSNKGCGIHESSYCAEKKKDDTK